MSVEKARELSVLLESIFAQAHTGLAFSTDAYDLDRYKKILAALGSISLLLSEDAQSLSNAIAYLNLTKIDIGGQEYVTPKVAVAVAAFDGAEEVLLVKRNEGLWALPGGYADVGPGPVQNAEKEVLEETGLEVKVVSLIGIYDSSISQFPSIGRQVYTLVFYAELLGGSIKPDPMETRGAAFFHPDSLPETPSVTRLQIERALRFFRGESLPAFIDRRE